MIVGRLSGGSGAFETMRVFGGTPFAWRRHIQRLTTAAHILGITPPDGDALRAAADAVLRENGLSEARLRVTILAGEPNHQEPDVIVGASTIATRRPTAEVMTARWPRNERAATVGVKSTSYAENVCAFADARDRGADEAIFANTRGELCEASGSNVFVVEEGVVRTPPASAGCLLGVTRALALELCAEHGIPAEEVAVPMSALARADEVFLTSTTREVQPVSTIDGRPLPGAPGPVSVRLAGLFSDLVARNPDP